MLFSLFVFDGKRQIMKRVKIRVKSICTEV
jgi:hypothetical protein